MQNLKKEEINISSMKTHQISKKWLYLACIKVSFSNQNMQNYIVTPKLYFAMTPKLYFVNESYIIIKLIWTIFAYNQN